MINSSRNDNPPSPLELWIEAIKKGQKQFAVLVDPDKCTTEMVPKLLRHLPQQATHIFVGGGLRQQAQIQTAWAAGADMVVVGTAIEEILFKSE